MNILYILSYAIFSIFLTLFTVEIGFALISLFSYSKYKSKINPLINPIWEVTGTFAIFYVVNFEVSYPTLVAIVGNAYAVPLLIAAIFLIMRNIFLAFSEYIANERSERLFRVVYSISTLAAAVLVMAVLTSGVSGVGISLATSTINSSFLINPFSMLILASLLLLALGLANSIVKLERFSKFGVVLEFIGFILAYIAIIIYLPEFNIIKQIPLFVISLILLAISVVLQQKKSKYSGAFNVLFIILLINMFGIATYPYIFGSVKITNYIATSALATPEILITLVGGAIVVLSLAALIYINYIKK